jgi:hypothetical protein
MNAIQPSPRLDDRLKAGHGEFMNMIPIQKAESCSSLNLSLHRRPATGSCFQTTLSNSSAHAGGRGVTARKAAAPSPHRSGKTMVRGRFDCASAG